MCEVDLARVVSNFYFRSILSSRVWLVNLLNVLSDTKLHGQNGK
jgi:hypothetical protein